MITVSKFDISVETLLATVSVSIDNSSRTLLTLLPSIRPSNYDDTVTLVESLDWSNTQPGNTYRVESGSLVEVPNKPGPSYIFDYTNNTWQDTRTQEQMWREVRFNRDVLLKASDWTQMPDVTLPNKEAWAVYRQALRDITNQLDPFNITWPAIPGA